MSFAPDFAQECRWFADLAILVAGFSCEIPDSRGRISSLKYADLNRKLALWYGRVREPPAKSGAKLRSPNLTRQRKDRETRERKVSRRIKPATRARRTTTAPQASPAQSMENMKITIFRGLFERPRSQLPTKRFAVRSGLDK